MNKVGLTGGIGSGKSTVAEFWRSLGIPVYDSDSQARRVMNSSMEVVEAVKELFGEAAYCDGQLDRAYIASKVFTDVALLEKLNAIVHPAVQKDFVMWSERQDAPYVIEESALLFECGASEIMDFNVVVSASQSVRIERACSRDGVGEQKIMERMNNQMPQERMVEFADFNIINEERLLIPQIIEIDRTIRNKINK
ncbi:MAG: dephospho-CoA kinase [Rikenellaceae bacterium]